MLADVVDNGSVGTPDLTREAVGNAVRRLQNGKAAGADRIIPQLMKNDGEAVIN